MRARRHRRVRDGDDGFATILVLGLAMALLVLGGAIGAARTVDGSRHRAEAVADVAALAGAKHALEGERAACGAARRLVQEQRAVLLACRLDGLDTEVTVGVAPPGRLSSLGMVMGRARAGRR